MAIHVMILRPQKAITASAIFSPRYSYSRHVATVWGTALAWDKPRPGSEDLQVGGPDFKPGFLAGRAGGEQTVRYRRLMLRNRKICVGL